MKIAIINTDSRSGGAAIAAHRLFLAMKAQDSTKNSISFIVKSVGKDQGAYSVLTGKISVKIAHFKMMGEYLFTEKILKKRQVHTTFSPAFFGVEVWKHPKVLEADLLNLHWVNHGFLSLDGLRKLVALNKPIVWHLHDMWPFTGGCHYAGTCTGFQNGCGNCPMLRISGKNDISARIYEEKLAILNQANITFVGASEWIAAEARKSKITENHTVISIPNPIDTQIFAPLDKQIAKKELGWNLNKKWLLFVAANANDPRKGFVYLKQSLQILFKKNPNIGLAILGKPLKTELADLEQMGLEIKQMGYIGNEKQKQTIYSAADTFVLPSLEDNLPNTIVEAMSCGTPVAAFAIGGIPQLLDQNNNGFMAAERDASALAIAIESTLNTAEILGRSARNYVLEHIAVEVVGKKYLRELENRIKNIPE